MTKCTCGKRVPNAYASNHIETCKGALSKNSLQNARKIMRGKVSKLKGV